MGPMRRISSYAENPVWYSYQISLAGSSPVLDFIVNESVD